MQLALPTLAVLVAGFAAPVSAQITVTPDPEGLMVEATWVQQGVAPIALQSSDSDGSFALAEANLQPPPFPLPCGIDFLFAASSMSLATPTPDRVVLDWNGSGAGLNLNAPPILGTAAATGDALFDITISQEQELSLELDVSVLAGQTPPTVTAQLTDAIGTVLAPGESAVLPAGLYTLQMNAEMNPELTELGTPCPDDTTLHQYDMHAQATLLPEPSQGLSLAAGVAGLLLGRRVRRKRA